MLDYQVEQALIDLITPQLPQGTVIRHAMAAPGDDETYQGLVIKATLERVEPVRRPRYVFRCAFSYVSLVPDGDITTVENVLTALESALSSRPVPPPASLSAFSLLATEQDAWDRADHRIAGERRENLREILVSCIPS